MALVGLLCCALVLAMRDVGPQLRYAVIALLVVAWGTSSARLLFVYPYTKDDVRTALQTARSQGLPILWDAGDRDAAYYGGYEADGEGQPGPDVPPTMPTTHWRKLTPIIVPSNDEDAQAASFASRLTPGDYVMVKGKADVFDPGGNWNAAMAGWHPYLLNRLNGFDVWRVTLPPHESRTPQ